MIGKALYWVSFFCIGISLVFTGCNDHFIPKITSGSKIKVINNDTVSALSVTDKEVARPDQDKYYHYYFHNRTGRARGGYLGKLLDGEFASYNRNANLIERGAFKEGLKDGVWITWHINGEIKSKTRWNRGVPLGNKIIYNDRGDVVEKYRWKDRQWEMTRWSKRQIARKEKAVLKKQKLEDRKEKKAEKRDKTGKRKNRKENKSEQANDVQTKNGKEKKGFFLFKRNSEKKIIDNKEENNKRK